MFESPAFQRMLERLAARPVHEPSNADVRTVMQMRARDACEYCLMPTWSRFEVDHIIPAKPDESLFWQSSNHQALCKPCHSEKTATEDGGFGNSRGPEKFGASEL